ncbi:MAG: transcriptional regulator PpsR [Pseudomonadota bacterium]
MDDRIGNLSEMGFANVDKYLSGLSVDSFGQILLRSSDVILIVTSDDTIADVGMSSQEIFTGGGRSWRGRQFLEIVTPESGDKVTDLLSNARKGEHGKPRQVNHPLPETDDLPVTYQAIKLNDDGDVILFGRCGSQVAALQRRLMSSQLAMEREVSKLRNDESRYRATFQLSRTPQMIVDAASLRILDLNGSAAALLGKAAQKLENKKVLGLFDDNGSTVLHKLMLAAIDSQENGDAVVRLATGEPLRIHIVTFRQDGKSHLLLSITTEESVSSVLPNTSETRILNLVKNMPDAFVVTDSDLTILTANDSFFDLLNLSGLGDAEGVSLESFFERPAVDCKVLIGNVKEHSVVRRFASAVKTRFGQAINVEIAACQLQLDDHSVLGFWMRPTNNIIMGAEVEQENISRSNEQIANLVGHMSLKEIVRETTEMIEALCIETALELTKNNRASAAQMLGVSRQSLYSKLGGTKGEK